MVTLEELHDRQSMPLEFKVRYSGIIIREWIKRWGRNRVAVAKSGFDSEVMLHLVRKEDPSIPAVFVDTGQENATVVERNREIENVVWIRPEVSYHEVVKKHGYPAISKIVSRKLHDLQNPTPRNVATRNLYLTGYRRDGVYSPNAKLPECYRYLIDCGFRFSNACCYLLKIRPLQQVQNAFMPFVGTLAEDSRERRRAYLNSGCNAFDQKHPQSRPIAFWTRQDLYEYAKAEGLKYPSCYGEITEREGALATTGETHTGCEGCLFGIKYDPTRIERVKQWSPARYRYYMEDLDYQRLIPLLLADKGGQMPMFADAV